MTLKNATTSNFINFLTNSPFLKENNEEFSTKDFLKSPIVNNSPDSPTSLKYNESLFGQTFKMKMNAIVLNEKKMFYEIFDRLIMEEKREVTGRERELFQELASHQAKMIFLENELKEQKQKNSELFEKNLNYGKQVQSLLEEREDFFKNKAYFEKKMKRLENSNKPTFDKLDQLKKLINFDKNKIQAKAYEKANKATILFSPEYKIEIIPPQSESLQKQQTSKTPKKDPSSNEEKRDKKKEVEKKGDPKRQQLIKKGEVNKKSKNEKKKM